jgi:thiosulfate/3-mercaptopyruvate sulfurtransferase
MGLRVFAGTKLADGRLTNRRPLRTGEKVIIGDGIGIERPDKGEDMSKVLKHGLLGILGLGLLLAPAALAAGEGIRGRLAGVDWLEKNLGKPGLLILEAAFPPNSGTDHIPGAVGIDLFGYGLQEMPLADVETILRSSGISLGKKVVVYDQGGGMGATRLFFSLYYFGFPLEDLFILDGGLSKWLERGLPVTKDPAPAPKKGTFRIARVRENARVLLPEVLAASGDPLHRVLLEALGPDWHFGQTLAFTRAGHIPNAVLLPSADFYNPDKTFKSAEEIRRMLTYLGVGPERPVYTYCGGGVAASVPFFALKFILNYPEVRLYVESEMGWLSDERGLPYWTYDAPFLMRDAGWLRCWGGQMLRSLGLSRVSVIDVRPADAFNEGHVPFALNVPAEAFKGSTGDPARLAEILGPAGVDASEEAVVVSGAGLTPDSALAFVMLERLGQEKVSVLMDSRDKWSQLGLAVTKAPTAAGPRKSAMDPSIPPGSYAGNFRADVVITDPTSTRGVYPKVFLASGKEAPAKAPQGKVVRLPYADLLCPDGTPRAAKDIWNILAQAGVPRYAELVCFADDPGEAAVNYFILKLMGYPDVKVLLI